MKVVRTRRGVRLVQRGLVLSEVSATPGPTDSLFDVLAATIAALAPGIRVGILGFAAGGIIAPLRAMGFGHPLAAVDLSLEGERIFRDVSGPWVGRVEVAEEDAVLWLRRRRQVWDLLLEDLSVEVDGDVTKPAVSFAVLPGLMRRRLARQGVAVFNLLPVPGLTWRALLDRVAAPFAHVQVIVLDDYENRVLLAGALPSARETSRTLRRHLEALGSDQADRLTVRTWTRTHPA